MTSELGWVTIVFLSTLSLRRATHGFLRGLPKEHLFLSTLSLRRATLGLPAGQPSTPGFLSTLSLRRATSFGNSCTQAVPISIHALLAESDS